MVLVLHLGNMVCEADSVHYNGSLYKRQRAYILVRLIPSETQKSESCNTIV
ncbi:hypothetical protein V5J35_000257 [Endozoicomonas sp. NE40]|uniref:Uncharacterized protein n=1 Tax=Endozoicomonas lisbonensis TaxID=3120522 RepID=A0ABV2SBC8_9GAMM